MVGCQFFPMTRTRSTKTKDRILQAAADILRGGGPAALTFDAVAARLGLSKQAVIYWFPSKPALMSELSLPGLRDEARAVIAALAGIERDPPEAARRVVLALIRFHLADLPRFRLIYLSPQIGKQTESRQTANAIVAQVHPVTAQMYAAFADALGDGPQARETAVALHMAALGHVLMVALTDAIDDPLRHAPADLAERLATVLAAGVRGEGLSYPRAPRSARLPSLAPKTANPKDSPFE